MITRPSVPVFLLLLPFLALLVLEPAAAAQEKPIQAGANRPELQAALAALPPDQRVGMEFLITNMPEQDRRTLSAAFLVENVKLAYAARARAPWGQQIPPEIFLNDVLPYAQVNEPRDPWRKDFHARLWPLVKDCERPGEAAQVLNEKIFGLLGVKYSTKRKRADQSPRESIESGLASCTGLSILLADACRAVGVPARLAGIPRWVNKRGNHTWVEIWDGEWHFTGAAEPNERGLDHTWFQHDASLARRDSRMNAIYAASFRRTGLTFPITWARDVDWIHAVNVTERYAAPSPSKAGITRLMIEVRDGAEGPRIAATVELTDVQDRTKVHGGTTRDEQADTNDHLTLEVPGDREYEFRITYGERSLVLTHRCKKAPQELVTFHLPEDELAVELRAFFGAEKDKQAGWSFAPHLERRLAEDEDGVRAAAWNAYRSAGIHDELRRDFEQQRVRFQEHESPYTVKEVGKQPPGGWPLFIAMHGGGGAPKEVNDRGWRTMQRYYRDQPSVPGYLYLALRAPNDRWNGFYDDYVYPLIENLIRQFLLFADVDPNRVFIMGYSHGGYGAFAIGPKIPDHFAAVHSSAAAPTDGESSPKNLRNTIFTFMIGERDHAHGRLKRCQAFNEAILELRGERTDIYPVTMEYKEGHGHGGLPDRDKIKDMYPAVRRPVPRELTWELTDGVVSAFYWLRVPAPAKDQEIEAICRDNQLHLTTRNVESFSVLLDSRLADLTRPITIHLDGRELNRQPRPSLVTLCTTLAERGDPWLAFTTRIELESDTAGK